MVQQPDPARISQILAGGVSADVRRRLIRGVLSAARPGVAAGQREITAAGISYAVQATPALEQWAEARFPELIVGVNEETRRVVQQVVQQGIREGLGADAIGHRLEDQFGTWTAAEPGKQSRAEMIARTESAEAYNRGTVQSYRETGLIERVRVHDGDADEPCAAANGAEWTLDEALANPLAHPNCVRSFSPVLPR